MTAAIALTRMTAAIWRRRRRIYGDFGAIAIYTRDLYDFGGDLAALIYGDLYDFTQRFAGALGSDMATA
jgi:hypothetical protein